MIVNTVYLVPLPFTFMHLEASKNWNREKFWMKYLPLKYFIFYPLIYISTLLIHTLQIIGNPNVIHKNIMYVQYVHCSHLILRPESGVHKKSQKCVHCKIVSIRSPL